MTIQTQHTCHGAIFCGQTEAQAQAECPACPPGDIRHYAHMARRRNGTAKFWTRSLRGAGWYISADDRFTAELRPAGYYSDLDCKLTRHYAIRVRGSQRIIGTATTLDEAARIYGVDGCRR